MIVIPHLETDVTTTCQLSCVSCNHAAALWRVAGPHFARPSQVLRDLSLLARHIHTPAWGALGGDPLLHPQLNEILRAARDSGIADRIEVWTNGLAIYDVTGDFWKSFDVLVLSRYPGVSVDELYIKAMCNKHHVELVIKDERVMHNFCTLLEPQPTQGEITRRKFQQCFFRSFSRVANEGFFFTCCVSPQLPFLIQGRPYGADGLAISESLTEADIAQFLSRTEPLKCCDICACRTRPHVWRQERDPERWLDASTRGDA